MKRSKHSLSHYQLLTCNMGELVPAGILEVLPGDTIQHATSLLIRCTPLNAPVMHPVHVRVHHWFVPHRLVWDDFENFITGGLDGADASVFPTITVDTGSGWAVGSLADYLGVPTGVDDLPVSALPFRGYSLIWNEFYRDEQLQTALTIDTTDGADTTTNTTLQNVCWEKDYFTTSRPNPQLGTAVSLPLGTSAPVVADAFPMKIKNDAAGTADLLFDSATNNLYAGSRSGTWNNGASVNIDGDDSNIIADLSSATAATINDLREALAIQRYQEARNLYGARYSEYLRFLGIRSSDARLSRPEYLAGGRQTIQFSEVLQTGVTTSGTPTTGVGSMQGHGIAAVRSNRYRRFFEEHGYVFTLVSVLPKTMYVTGLPRHWSRTTKEDFFQKELQHIGQQEILNKELYWADSGPNDVFGYQNRYDEYRRTESSVHGDFRTSSANFWHLGRIFTGDVTLNSSFVGANPSTRIFQSTATDGLYIMAMHSIQARRLVSKSGAPGRF